MRPVLHFVWSFSVGIVSFVAIKEEIHKYKKYYKTGWVDKLMSLVSTAYIIPFLIGCIETCALYGILPYYIKTIINTIFGGWQQERVCITSGESSWASIQMIIAFCANYYCFKCYKNHKYRTRMIISILLLCITMSLHGILTFGIGIALYFLFLCGRDGKIHISRNFIRVIFGSLIVLLGFNFLLTLMPDTYYAQRVAKILSGKVSFKNFIYLDGATFMRIGSLLVHCLMFIETHGIGVGGGGFRSNYSSYIKRYFSEVLYMSNMQEPQRYVINDNISGTFSLYFSILSEEGIIGVIIFAVFLCECLKHLKKMKKETILFIAVILATPIQFESWCYVPFWLALALSSEI